MLDHQYQPGEHVSVDDGVRKFTGVVAAKNPKNTAEYEIRASDGRTWLVHWCYLKRRSA
jgi:hypothetical protein